jgi:pimeloyl-ACP methyl ester carboxylesterase
MATDLSGAEFGKVYYVAGAGTIGHSGTLDVPAGLKAAGYKGAIEAFAWQALIGDTIRDQIDRERNAEQAGKLAESIQAYLDENPGRSVHIIAFSAGTGIATWALEDLPPRYSVSTVVFLGSSLRADYDLSNALLRVQDRIYNFFSPHDPVLRIGVPITGTVDREEFDGSKTAGQTGFYLPRRATEEMRALYRARFRNVGYQKEWAKYAHFGLHADITSAFIEHVISRLLRRAGRDVEGAWTTAEKAAEETESEIKW